MKITQNEQKDLIKFRHGKSPKARTCIAKVINEAKRRNLQKIKSDPKKTGEIPEDVLDSMISIIDAENYELTRGLEDTGFDTCLKKVQLISVDFNQREPSDKIDVMSDCDYNSIEAKTGFGIIKVFDNLECIWNEYDPKNYATHVLKYKNAEEFFITILRKDSSLIHLKSSNLKSRFRLVEDECFSFNHLKVIKVNGKMARYSELIKEFEMHHLKIWFPFLADEVVYKGETIFKDDKEIFVSLSIDLLTGNIEAHSYRPSGKQDPIEWVFKSVKSTVEKPKNEKPNSTRSCTDVVCDVGSTITEYWNKSKSYPKGQDYYCRTVAEISNSCGKTVSKFLDSMPFVGALQILQSLYEPIPNNSEIEFMEVDIDRREHDEYIVDLYPNFRHYRAPKDTVFYKILENGKVIWMKEMNGESIKEVYVYINESEKWLVNVFNDNTIKFLHKPAGAQNWIDKSSSMLNTRDLSVIKRNLEKLLSKDLAFDFTGSFCILPLGDVLSVSYKGEVYDLKECGEHLSVFLLYDILKNELYVFNNSI